MREVARIEEALFVLVYGVALYIVHDDSEGIVPVPAIALKPDVDIVDIDHCVVHDPDEVLLCKGLLLVALVPLLLHLHPYALYHALQQFVCIYAIIDLLVADVQQHVDAPYVDEGVLLLETRPGDVYVYLFDVAEFEREGQAQLVDKTRLQGHVLNGHLAVQQPDVQTVLEAVYVLA